MIYGQRVLSISNLSEIELSIKAVLLLFLLLSVCKVHHCSDDETFTRMSKSLYLLQKESLITTSIQESLAQKRGRKEMRMRG